MYKQLLYLPYVQDKMAMRRWYLHDFPKRELPKSMRQKILDSPISYLFFQSNGKWYFYIDKHYTKFNSFSVAASGNTPAYSTLGYYVRNARRYILKAVKNQDLTFHYQTDYIFHSVYNLTRQTILNKDIKLPINLYRTDAIKRRCFTMYGFSIVFISKPAYFRALTALRFLARRIYYASKKCQHAVVVIQ